MKIAQDKIKILVFQGNLIFLRSYQSIEMKPLSLKNIKTLKRHFVLRFGGFVKSLIYLKCIFIFPELLKVERLKFCLSVSSFKHLIISFMRVVQRVEQSGCREWLLGQLQGTKYQNLFQTRTGSNCSQFTAYNKIYVCGPRFYINIYHHALVLETLVTNNDFKCSILLTILQFSILQSPLNLRCLLCLCIFVEIIAIYNICRCGKLAITLK